MYRWSLLVLVLACAAHAEDAPTRTVIRFEVAARPAPKPVLRYQLLPELREIGPGTALQQYMKCLMEQHHFYGSKEAIEDREKFVTMPLKDLPLDKVRNYGGKALRNADLGARMERIEWQILQDLRRDGYFTLLPEVQKLRAVAQALRVRMRGEIAQKKFDDAVETAKTLLKMAHQLGEHPTLIGNLVGFALVAMTAQHLEELLQQPGSPNLYWALASLPEPLVALRAGAQAERMVIRQTLDVIGRDDVASEAKLDKAVAELDKIFDGMNLKEGLAGPNPTPGQPAPKPVEKTEDELTLKGFLAKHAKDARAVESARKRLIEEGASKGIVEKMSARQVVYLRNADEVKTLLDERVKWLTFPYRVAMPHYARQVKPKGVLFELLPMTSKVHTAQARTEQRLKMLQVLGAIHLYAAANENRVPAKLADLEVPVPDDPMTGKAFRYSVEKGVATLTGTPPPGMEKVAAYNVVYEIKFVK